MLQTIPIPNLTETLSAINLLSSRPSHPKAPTTQYTNRWSPRTTSRKTLVSNQTRLEDLWAPGLRLRLRSARLRKEDRFVVVVSRFSEVEGLSPLV